MDNKEKLDLGLSDIYFNISKIKFNNEYIYSYRKIYNIDDITAKGVFFQNIPKYKRIGVVYVNKKLLKYNINTKNMCCNGLEDCTLFIDNNELNAIICCRNQHNIFYMLIYNIDKDLIINFKVKSNLHQKNWMPITYNEKCYFIYDIKRGLFLSKNDNITINIEPELRGNSKFINIGENKYIGICHKVISKKYFHYVIICYFDSVTFKLLEQSGEIRFSNHNIEFVSSFELEHDKFSIIYSVNDTENFVVYITKDELMKLFNQRIF